MSDAGATHYAVSSTPSLPLLLEKQHALAHHPVFARLVDVNAVRRFMGIHVFAVWDFMSLLKAMQRELTCVSVPWRPSPHPAEMVRLVNEIVLGEESDRDAHGRPTSHFSLYLEGMREIGADTAPIESFLSDLDLRRIPEGPREFVSFTLETARERDLVEIAASFFFGRERVIPSMFDTITRTLRRESVPCDTFLWYLDRHIHVDGEEHGPMAERCLDVLCGGDDAKRAAAIDYGLRSVAARQRLWDVALDVIEHG